MRNNVNLTTNALSRVVLGFALTAIIAGLVINAARLIMAQRLAG